jgi:hypothetical protein
MPPDTLRRWSLDDVDGLFADVETARVVVEPERTGPGSWAGAPSAVADDGAVFLAYRLRRPVGQGRGYANVVARSEDGEHLLDRRGAAPRRVRRRQPGAALPGPHL